ncbi:MAG: carboxypeptidase regulatory-like domain-containing protein, partial [Bacteroidota bacterium]
MKDYQLVLLFLCFGLPLVGQSDIGGKVTDSTSTSLPGANVVLLRASDSLLVAFATTDNKGDFLLENVPVGTHQMHVSFLGFERSPQIIEVSEDDQYLGLGDLVMFPAGYLLNNVEVTADRIPIRMVGDTMMYDAEAFAVGQNATVEDLLRRLPGMSIDANGSITWRGQTINQVLVNGRPFFAGNSSLITQNLEAEAISNVEVFDQQTNREELSGIDDGI